jgi:hypothetical protein
VILYSGPKAQHHCSLLYGSLALALILPSKIIQNKIKQDCNNYVLSLNVQRKHFFFFRLGFRLKEKPQLILVCLVHVMDYGSPIYVLK